MNKKSIRITGTNAIVFMILITGYNDNWRCRNVANKPKKRTTDNENLLQFEER